MLLYNLLSISSFGQAFSTKVKMKKFVVFIEKIESLFLSSWNKFACLYYWCRGLLLAFLRVLVFRANPIWIHLSYFIILSLLGHLALKVSKPKITSFRPTDMDVFFMSVSAVTVSSMSTIEMEFFSNIQLLILTLLMLVGSEVFTSMLGLQLLRSTFTPKQITENRVDAVYMDTDSSNSTNSVDQIELGLVIQQQIKEDQPPNSNLQTITKYLGCKDLKYNSIKCLAYVVLSYLLVVHVSGYTLVSLYIGLVPSASKVLERKGLSIHIFSLFTTVSTFANVGFVPTNENMAIFKKNSGLLLILIPQVLLGNTLYPSCIRLVIMVLERLTKRVEFTYLLENYRDLGYSYLLSTLHSCLLVVTVLGFILVQFIFFCSMEWSAEAMEGLNSYQKIVGSLFQVVNSRHAGESVFDLSIISPAMLAVSVVMMYLPPYTSFLPIDDHEKVSENDSKHRKEMMKFGDILQFSQLSYLVIFIVLICITERENLKEDPLNFNVFNIITEVISAYGNVGFSTGYRCNRQLKPDGYCKDATYGFAGRWSNKGKMILILVMFFGRLKGFHMGGGKAWKLS